MRLRDIEVKELKLDSDENGLWFLHENLKCAAVANSRRFIINRFGN